MTMHRWWRELPPAARFRLLAPRVGVALAVVMAWPREDLEAICG
jgi:hypothetical protein